MFRKPNGLKTKIPIGKRGIADHGYKKEEEKLAIRNGLDSQAVEKFKSRALARHESFNGRIKEYACLSGVFRHGVDKRKAVFQAVCVLTQYNMENGHPLFEV
jgi:hypothetical protein